MTEISQKKKLAMQKLQNLQKTAVKLIKQLTINEKSKKPTQQSKLRNLSDINLILIQIEKINPLQNQMFADEKLIVFVRHFFVDPTTNNKIPPLQFLRLIFVTEVVADRFLMHGIPLYISRIIERDDLSKTKPSLNSNFEQQTFQVLRLIKHWIEKFPKKFPQYLAFLLVAFAQLPVVTNAQQRKKDQIPQHIKAFAIDILLLMSSKNTKLCCICGGFNLLISTITDPVFHEKSYDIISKMIIFINDPKNRQLTSTYIDFKRVFHVLTDLDNVFLQQGYKTRNNLEMLSKFQSKLGLAKNAIVTLLKSWIGIVYIGNDPTAVSSLLQTLKQVPKKYDSELRNLIFEVLEEIIGVGDNIITASTAQQKNCYKISNLIGCYLMTVIELLIEQNLLRILIELSGVEESLVSEPSQRLLKRLTFLIFNYRPESSKYIDFLITAANKSNANSNQMLKTSSSFVINKIGNYIYDRKQKKSHAMFSQLQNLFSLKTIFIPYSRASLNSISKTLNFISYKQQSNYRKDLLQKQPIAKQHKQNYMRWKWDIIQNLLQFPDPDKYKSSNNQKYRQNKMYKYLLRFYSPSRGNFYKLDWHMSNFMYVKIGILLVKNSITIQENLGLVKNPPQSQFECTVSFIGDLQKLLQINITQCLKDSKQWNIVLCTKLQRQLLGFIGLFSQTKKGYEQLICQNRFMQLLHGCLARPECSHLVYLILINLDFYRDDINKITLKNANGTSSIAFVPAQSQIPSSLSANVTNSIKIGVRYLLQSCIKQGSYALKLGCVQIIKILLIAQVHMFTVFSYQLLIHILKSEPIGEEIVQVVVQFLQENLTNKNNVQIFLRVLSDMIIDLQNNLQVPMTQKANSESSNNSKEIIADKAQEQEPKNSLHEGKNGPESEYMKGVSFYTQNSKNINSMSSGSSKFRFEEIKSKLTTPMIMRLISNNAGIQLAQRYFPDWLDQQFQKWMQPDHNYCATLENKLNGVLNFAKKKEKGYYKITGNSHLYDLLFMYKLPWIIHVNQQKFPLWVRQRGQTIQFYVNFGLDGQKNDENKFLVGNDCLKIMLAIGNMLVDQQFNVITNAQNNAPLTIFLTLNSKKITLFGQKMMMVESNGVQVYYRKCQSGFDKNALKDKRLQMSQQEQWQYYNNNVENLNKLQILRIVINVKLPTVEHSQQLPLHLINELMKTKKGRNYIQNKKYIQKVGAVIQNFIKGTSPIPTPLQVRSTLFSLGFYGSRNEGARVLNQKKIFQNILKMTYSSPILSLRGTCRYILNMFTHSQYGRNILIQNGFHVNSRCFACYPMDNKKFFAIQSPLKKTQFILDEKYWKSYQALQKPLTKNEDKLFQLISLLINSLSFKSAVAQIREILKTSSKISNSVNLLQNVVNLLTFFKYKHQSRKSIMNVFEQLIRSPDFNSQLGNKIIFYINDVQVSKHSEIQIPALSMRNLSSIKSQQKIQSKIQVKTQTNINM